MAIDKEKTKSAENPINTDIEETEGSIESTEDSDSTEISESTDVKMDLIVHLNELRTRLIIFISTLLFFSIAAYLFNKPILTFVNSFIDVNLVLLSPAEGIFTTIKLSFYCGLLLSVPMFIYQTIKFVMPALSKKQKRYVAVISLIVPILFFTGVVFSLRLVIPFSLAFFLSFLPSDLVAPMISFEKYISYVFKVVVVFGLIFLEPLVIISVIQFKLISIRKLSKLRPYFIVINMIFAAIITPPDVVSQILMALPMLLFFELGLLVSKILFAKRIKRDAEANAAEETEA